MSDGRVALWITAMKKGTCKGGKKGTKGGKKGGY